MTLDLTKHPHRRLNVLSGEWVQVSPQRTKRPWQGREEETSCVKKPEYDPKCYLCPGNSRAGGVQNEEYEGTFSFTNDFSALEQDVPPQVINQQDLLVAKGESGICRVICFSPRHDLTLPELKKSQIRQVVDMWVTEYNALKAHSSIHYIQVFENKGEIMGCSNPHPHGQIWAQQSVPDEPAKELQQQSRYFKNHGRTLLEDYLALELDNDQRVVVQNEHFVVVVPYWAFWPFEALLISRRAFPSFTEMTEDEKNSLADSIQQITTKFDNVFEISFPYSAGFHPAPTDGKEHPEWHFHMHFYPPLLRSATVKKFRVGYEMLANPQRDVTPEASAELLKALPIVHYKHNR